MAPKGYRVRGRKTRDGRVCGEVSVGGNWIDLIGEDLLQNVLSRLPALSFASAACVSRTWNRVCDRILSRPKFASAISTVGSIQIDVEDVLKKVLKEPIRPHFAIVSVSPTYSFLTAYQLISKKLGSRIPVIAHESEGIIGRNAVLNKYEEVQIQWRIQEDFVQDIPYIHDSTYGIMLMVGYVPGLKVNAIPLLQRIEVPRVPLVDKFVMDIRDYTVSVSGCASPVGIIMFGVPAINMKSVLCKMDYAMPMETSIVGGENCNFIYRSEGDSGHHSNNSVGIALVFAHDRNKPHGIGETEFHVALSTGVSAVGPIYKAVAVKERRHDSSTWLTARRLGLGEILDGQRIISEINDEIGDLEYPALFIGVMKRRKFSVGLEKVRWVTSLEFHEVTGGDEEYLFVHGDGIKTADSFCFYKSDPSAALSSCRDVSETFRSLKQDWDSCSRNKKEAFGCIIFSCCSRGDSFFATPDVDLPHNIDSSPLLENFPGLPLCGTFCGGEIGRGSSSLYVPGDREQTSSRCCLHVYSTAYLLMTYTPKPLED